MKSLLQRLRILLLNWSQDRLTIRMKELLEKSTVVD